MGLIEDRAQTAGLCVADEVLRLANKDPFVAGRILANAMERIRCRQDEERRKEHPAPGMPRKVRS